MSQTHLPRPITASLATAAITEFSPSASAHINPHSASTSCRPPIQQTVPPLPPSPPLPAVPFAVALLAPAAGLLLALRRWGASPRAAPQPSPMRMAATAAPEENEAAYVEEGFQWKGAVGSELEDWEARGGLVDMPSPCMFAVDRRGAGAGRTALLLHGFPSLGYAYREALDPILQLPGQPYARVIVADWPGWGGSEKPAPGPAYGYSPEELVGSLDLMLRAVLAPGERVTVVVQGLAAPLALGWAARHPDRVEAVVAINPPLGCDGGPRALPKPLQAFLNPFMGPILAQDPTRWADGPFRGAGRFMPSEPVLAAYRAPFLRDGLAGVAAMATVKGLASAGTARLWAEWEAQQATDSTAIPALLLLGSEDRYTQCTYNQRATAGREAGFPSAQRLKGAGHFAAEDWPPRLVAALLGFGPATW